MTVFHPCLGCLTKNDCDIKRDVTKALKGQPISKATIRCDLPFTRDFPPGTRVLVGAYDHVDGEVFYDNAAGTVINRSASKRAKVLIYLDEAVHSPNGEELRFTTSYPRDLAKLDEPKCEMCKSCGLPLKDDVCEQCDRRHTENVVALRDLCR